MSFEAPLFIQSDDSFLQVAELISKVALVDFVYEERDGLNIGGGDYYKFRRGREEVFLVCNDLVHGEVFRPDRAEYQYYCYTKHENDATLEAMRLALTVAGVTCGILSAD